MAEWQLVTVSKVSGYSYYDYITVKKIADLIGGSVNYASELGYTSITGLWNDSYVPAMNKLPIYIPDGSVYGIIFYAGASYGSADLVLYFVLLSESGDVHTKGSMRGGCYGATIRIFAGSGFSVLADSMSASNYYRGWCAFDSFENVRLGGSCSCVMSDTGVLDLEHEKLEDQQYIYYLQALSGSNIEQADSSLFGEYVPFVAYDSTSSACANILIAENIMLGLYDYSNTEKIIEVNGVKLSSIMNSRRYFPTE